MGEVLQRAGGGGGKIFLLLHGLPGTNITATLGSRTVTGVIGESGIFQTKLPSLGLWKVTAQRQTYSFEQTVKVLQYGITEGWAVVNKPFADCTPEEIQAVARSGMASQYWQIGDRHSIVLETGETIYVKIADFNHDVTPSGETIPLTLIMENCFNTTRQMNGSDTNVGGWANCQFRTGTMPGIKSSFPAEWQAIIKTAQKKTSAGNKSSVIVTTNDDLWLLSEIEIFGARTCSSAGEGSIYPIFTNAASRVARVNGAAMSWWERSPDASYPTSFGRATESGAPLGNYASYTNGVRVGLCVG